MKLKTTALVNLFFIFFSCTPFFILNQFKSSEDFNLDLKKIQKEVESHQKKYCILTLSRPDGFETRQQQRDCCRKLIYNNFSDSVLHKFVVGQPLYNTKDPSRKKWAEIGTEKEIAVSLSLIEEIKQFSDVLISPHRDTYMDLPLKRLFAIEWGVENQCQYTIKIDDEYCVNVHLLRQKISKHEKNNPHSEIYFGESLWKGTEFAVQKGPHGETVRYLSGMMNGMSFGLSSKIMSSNLRHHAILWAANSTTAEDRNLGLMVNLAQKTFNLSIEWEPDHHLVQSKLLPNASHQCLMVPPEIIPR